MLMSIYGSMVHIFRGSVTAKAMLDVNRVLLGLYCRPAALRKMGYSSC